LLLWLLRLVQDCYVWSGQSETPRLCFGKNNLNGLALGSWVCFPSGAVVNTHVSWNLGDKVCRIVGALRDGHVNCALPSFVGCECT